MANKHLSTRTIVMIIAGALLILFGVGSLVYENWIKRDPFDIVYVSSQDLDASDNFIPLLQESQDSSAGGTLEPSSGESGAGAAQGCIPEWLSIPAFAVEAPIVTIQKKEIQFEDQMYYQWLAPDYFAVGWHENSALLGVPGNTVLNGHHNIFGSVFSDLYRLQIGDRIEVTSGDRIFEYRVTANLLLPERYQPLETRLENARWIMPSDDERLTLVTCWPADSNTHRVVIVAYPQGTRNAKGSGECNQDEFRPAITPTPRLYILPTETPTATATRRSEVTPAVQPGTAVPPSQTPTDQPTATSTSSPTETPQQ